MKRLLTVLLAVFMAASLSLWIALPVGAQEEDEEEKNEFTLEEITVTAEKSEQDLQKISRSMAVLSAEDLKLNSNDSFMEALGNLGGVNFMGMWNHIYIRGIGHSTAEEGSEPGVQFNVDGAPALLIERATVSPMYMASSDVERIEVIRGPSGSVNGRSAAAGTVNVITKSPDFESLDGNVSLTMGNYDTVRWSAAINLPMKLTGLDLPSFLENLSFRLAMSENTHSPFVHNADGEATKGHQNQYSTRIKMKWQPIEPLTLDATFNYMRDQSDMGMSVPALSGSPGIMIPGGPPFPMFVIEAHEDDPWMDPNSRYNEPQANRQYSMGYEATYETPFATIYGRYNYNWVPVNCRGDEPFACYEGKRGQKDYEIRLNSPEDSRITWNVGAYFFNKKTYVGPGSQMGQVDPEYEPSWSNFYGNTNLLQDYYDLFDPRYEYTGSNGWSVSDPDQPWTEYNGIPVRTADEVSYFQDIMGDRPINSYSGFANATIPLFEDRHRLVVGLRKNFERKERLYGLGVFGGTKDPDDPNYNAGFPNFYWDPNLTPEGDPNPDLSGTWRCNNCEVITSTGPDLLKTDDDPVSFTLGWEYDWRPEVMFYIQAANGYKPGGISPNAHPNRFYEPETLINYALGTKSRWFDQRLQLNAELYFMDYDNYQSNLANDNMILVYTDPDTDITYSTIGFQSITVNFPKTQLYGFDIDYEWLITPVDRFKGSINYKHNDFADFVFYMGPSTDVWRVEYADFSGRMMPFAPRFNVTADYSHMFNFGNFQVTPRVSFKYSTKYFMFQEYWMEMINPEMWQPAYTKYDAYVNIGPQDGKWGLNLYWKNITEEPIRMMALFTSVSLDEPMTYGATFNVRF